MFIFQAGFGLGVYNHAQGTCGGRSGWFPSNYTEESHPPLPPIPVQAVAVGGQGGGGAAADGALSAKVQALRTRRDGADASPADASPAPDQAATASPAPANPAVGKRSSLVSAKEYAAAALAAKADEEDPSE